MLSKRAFGIRQHVVIPEAYDAISPAGQPGVTLGVCPLLCLLPAIEIDDEAVLQAEEIEDVRTERLLAARSYAQRCLSKSPTRVRTSGWRRGGAYRTVTGRPVQALFRPGSAISAQSEASPVARKSFR